MGATALLSTSGALVAPSDALAFCRSTTCSGDCPRDVEGCKTTGAKLYWPSSCVSFSLQKDGSEHIDFAEVKRVVAESFVAWSQIECPDGVATMAFSQYADTVCHKAEYDPSGTNANNVLFQDYKWEYASSDNTLAKTTVTYDTDTGEIFDSDIELNHAYNEFTTGDVAVEYDLQSILTHEIGHFIGLDHTSDFLGTMNASYDKGSTDLRTLESDDQAAICAAYPPEREAACKSKPNGGFSSQCAEEDPGDEATTCSYRAGSPGGSSGPWLAALFAGLALAVRRPRGVVPPR